MDPNIPESNNQPLPPQENTRFRSVIIVILLILIAAGAVGIFFPFNNIKQTKNSSDQISPSTQKTPIEISPAANKIKDKYQGVTCRRYTSVEEALMEVEIACVLDLSGQNLKEVPREIPKLINLNEIDLSNNNLTVFPSELLGMQKLISLNLSNNNIPGIPANTNIPPTIQNLLLTGNNISKEQLERFQRFPGTPAPTRTLPSQN